MMKLRNVLSLGLALAIVMSLAACGGPDNSPSGSNTPPPSTNTDAATSDTPASDPVDNQPAQLISQYGVDLTKYADLDWPTVKLTGAAMTDSDGAIGAPMRFYFDLISEASGGKVTFEEFWEAQLCTGQDTYENVRDGIADFGQTPINYEYSPYILYQVCFTLPFITPNPAVSSEALAMVAEQFPEFAAREQAIGVHIATVVGEANYQVPTTDKLDPDNFDLSWYNGSKLALGSSFFSRWCSAVGVVPVTGLGAPACYEAYTTGVINGVFGYDSMMYDWQYIEVCNSMIEQDIGALGGVASVWNLDTWNSFSPEIQTALDELAVQARVLYNDWRSKKEAQAHENMYADGLIQVKLTDEQRQEWADKIFANDEYNTIKMWINDAANEGYNNGKEIVHAWANALQELGYKFPYDVDAVIG